ncbi:MAG: lmo0937 family membrane protein [Flavobacteriales bacterium]|nr:lmo0937 family membrane protein [Flavobacteriales bacterium]
MNNLVNIIIVLLIVGWLVGFIGFGAMVGNLIHILLILAIVGILFRLLGGKRNAL